MATNPDQLIAGLLAGTGFGRTPGDYSLQNAQIAGQQQQNQIGAFNLATAQQQQADAQQEQQQFQGFIRDYGADPTPNKLLDAMVRFPKQYQALKSAYDAKDDAARTADLGYHSGVYSAVTNGKYDLAASAIDARIKAERAAGKDTSVDQQYVDGLRAGDKNTINALKAQSLADIAVAVGRDKFAQTYGAVGDRMAMKGQVVGRAVGHYDESGKWVTDYRDPEEIKYLPNRPEGYTPVNPEGGDPASGGAGASGSGAPRYTGGWTPRARHGGDNPDAVVDNKIGGMSSALGIAPDAPFPTNLSNMEIAKALAISEGGKGTLADRNNNPGNLTDGSGGFRKFPSKEAGLAAAAAQVARNRARGQNTIQSMVEGVPTGGNAGPIGVGGIRPSRMTPQQVQAEGLDPKTVYYRDANGVPQAVSGQTRPTKQAAQLTEAQGKATGYLGTVIAASNTLNSVKGYSPSIVSLALNDLSNKNPIKQAMSQVDRRVMNAQLAFATALLRLESGAVVGKDEAAAKAQVLFPQPGDGPEVQADKRAQREAGVRALRTAAGPGSESVAQGLPPGGRAPAAKPAATGGIRILSVRPK